MLPSSAAPQIDELRALGEKGRLNAVEQQRALELVRELQSLAHGVDDAAQPPKRDDGFTSIWDEEPSIWDDKSA